MFTSILRAKLKGIVELTGSQISQLEEHYALLLRWNQSLNLTTVTSLNEAVERHYCESIFLAAHLPPGELRIVDIGSGPGFPGLPIAVFRTESTVTLVESHQRKAVFLKEAARKLANVRVIAKRGEALTERFDVLVSRAVSCDDLAQLSIELAGSVALLTGSEPCNLPTIAWKEPIQLPWGQNRYLRQGLSQQLTHL